MNIHKMLIGTAAAAMIAVLAPATTDARADAQHTTYITLSGAVQLPGTELPAGRYVFQFASMNSHDAVLVRDAGTLRPRWLGLTNMVLREPNRRAPVLQLSEAPRGQAPRVLTFFPPDAASGGAFIY
jgi:hypothetical protein